MNGAIARTLPAMTAVQAATAMGTFALSVLAPQLGVDVYALGVLGSVLFGIGALSSLATGWLIRRFGDLPLAAMCMGAVLLAMSCLVGGALAGGLSPWALWPAVLLLGLAFGPETPACASVLARVTPAARRPWIFSIRQTGNQIGAMAGSLALPWLLARHAALPFALVAGVALLVGLRCLRLMTTDSGAPALASSSGDASGLRELLRTPTLRLLTLTLVVFMATQVCLNFFVMSHAVRHWQLPVSQAAAWVALMQGAGLVGRLLWGRVAQRPGMVTARLLGGLGLLIASAGLTLFLWPGTPPAAALAVLLVLVGISASGWNGVMMAEIARIAGPARAGAVTGAALMFGYAGLAIAPIAFAAAGTAWGTAAAYAGLLVATGAMGATLLLRRRF